MNLRNLYKVERPNRNENAVLDLASALHFAETTHPVVSWSAQERAYEFWRDHTAGTVLHAIKRYRAMRIRKAA